MVIPLNDYVGGHLHGMRGFFTFCVQMLQKITTVGTGYVDNITLVLYLLQDVPQTEEQ